MVLRTSHFRINSIANRLRRIALTVAIATATAFAPANAQDRTAVLQGVVEFDTLRVTIAKNQSDTVYFALPSSQSKNTLSHVVKVNRVAVPAFRSFNTGNLTLFFKSVGASVACGDATIRVNPLLYDGTVIQGDSVVASPGALSSAARWQPVDLTGKFLMCSGIRVIVSVGNCASDWSGVIALGRVR